MSGRKGFSETSDPYEAGNPGVKPVLHQRLRIDRGGRVVIPAEVRAAMMIKPGDTMSASVVDGELRLMSRDVAIRRAQELVRRYVPEGVSLVDELVAQRRADARRDTEN